MLVKRYYKKRLPSRIKALIEWIHDKSYFCFTDTFKDTDGWTERTTFFLSLSRVTLTIDEEAKINGKIMFQLEVELWDVLNS